MVIGAVVINFKLHGHFKPQNTEIRPTHLHINYKYYISYYPLVITKYWHIPWTSASEIIIFDLELYFLLIILIN